MDAGGFLGGAAEIKGMGAWEWDGFGEVELFSDILVIFDWVDYSKRGLKFNGES